MYSLTELLLVYKIAYSGVHQELHLAFNYREKQKKTIPLATPILLLLLLTASLPLHTVVHVVKVPGFSSTVPLSVTSLTLVLQYCLSCC